MIKIERGNITLTKGDSAYIKVNVDNYTYASGDTMVLTMKESIDDNSATLTKTIPGNGTFAFVPSDTSSLSPKTYVFDIKLNVDATDEVFTVIDTHNFTIVKGVG